MHLKNTAFPFLVILFFNLLSAQNKPFPQAQDYPNCIKPNNVTQSGMNNSVIDFYNYWKKSYLRASNGQTPGGWYVYSHPGDPDKKSVSEAHGYGMIIMALMAGSDDSAKIYFDGMVAMYNDHRSTIDSDLMSWIISPDEDPAKDEDNATDGDMDIAYALLLADKQWSSTGDIDYLTEAGRIITNGIKPSNTNNSRLMLGDWWMGDAEWEWATRSSDWMPDHLRSYFTATRDSFWLELSDSIYKLVSEITDNYSPITGLMPDFVDQQPPQPAPPNFLESSYDGQYNWNACRFPWRMAVDYAQNGTAEAKAAENKILSWLKPNTADNPLNIKPGYLLNGDPIPDRDYTSNAFTAPFIAACIVDAAHQQYLNDGWLLIKDIRESYYEDSINLLSMLLISGNWWTPDETTSLISASLKSLPASLELRQNYPNPFNPTTSIKYQVARQAEVQLVIYNTLGQNVRTLVDRRQEAGEHSAVFNADGLPSGIYYYRLQAGSFVKTRKMILLR